MVADVSQTVVYRFDVESDSIPLGHFIGTAQATRKILNNFSEKLFDEKGQFELYIIAPKLGSFEPIFGIKLSKKGRANFDSKVKWALRISVAMGVLIGGTQIASNVAGFMDTEIGKSFVTEFTGHEPGNLGKLLAGGTRNLPLDEDGKAISDDRSERIFVDKNGRVIAVSDDGVERTVGPDESAKIATAIMCDLTTRFMETEVSDLEKMDFGQKEFWEAYSGKNQMYKACASNRDVRGIGFGESGAFPVKRDDFKRHIVAGLPDKEEVLDDPQEEREVKTVTIYVNSPNWGRVGRGWQGIVEEWRGTAEEKPIIFSVDDDDFWQRVNRKDIKPVVGDRMKVQLTYVEVVESAPVGTERTFAEIEKSFAEAKSAPKRSKYKVVKVLSFNGEKISDPLDEELILERWDNDPPTGKADEPGFFDEHP